MEGRATPHADHDTVLALTPTEHETLRTGRKRTHRLPMTPQPTLGWTPYSFGEVHEIVDGMPDPDRIMGWGPSDDDGLEAYPSPFGQPGTIVQATSLDGKADSFPVRIMHVHVERLHEIREADAQFEGLERPILQPGPYLGTIADTPQYGHPATGEYRDAFKAYWAQRYANTPHAWNHNPWVWVYTLQATT